MGDRSPERKPEEQYPLLKVDGGGDSPMQPALSPGWAVQCPRNNSWASRWPELISACWMTLILVGISFLVFYALGTGAYRRQQFVFVKCNGSRPASNVFYHQLVQRGAQVPFLRHSEYLANMAAQYPNLNFNVFFLIDDSYTARGPRSNRFINKLIPYYPYGSYSYKADENYQQALIEFQRRYLNVNVTVMPLSKYMAGTPLRFKWRTIPTSYLPFYARVYSVWENGGIGIDLALHSVYDDNLSTRRKAAILKQHNSGINAEAYANALSRIDKEEDTAAFAMFFGLVNRFFNETRSFFNRSLSFAPLPSEPKPEVLVRTHRAKRDVTNDSVTETTTLAASNSSVDIEQSNKSYPMWDLPQAPFEMYKNAFGLLPNATKDLNNKTDSTQVVLFYDFQIVSDNIGPSYVISDPSSVASEFGPAVVKSRDGRDVRRSVSHLLSIDAEGSFVAASSRLHPLLGHMISSGCQRMAPKFAIQDAVLSQCSGKLREDVYCNNIYIL